MPIKVDGKDTTNVVGALTRQIQTLPSEVMASLTWDRGTELAAHKAFTIATDATVYFCDPQSPWQRGSNENTNGLLRQYLPKRLQTSQPTAKTTSTDRAQAQHQTEENPRLHHPRG